MQWPNEKEQMDKDLHYIENNRWSKTNPTNTGGDQYVLRKGVQFLCSFPVVSSYLSNYKYIYIVSKPQIYFLQPYK
jgi:hypothetical protein